MSSTNPRNQAISDLDPSVFDICLYFSIDNLDRDGVITKANDRMLRGLPRDHPILASLEAWELPGLFTLDDDPHRFPFEANFGDIDIDDDEAVDSLTDEEFLTLARDVFLDTKLSIKRAEERESLTRHARLDSTIAYLSKFDHPGVRKFLLALDRLAHELGAIPELTRNSVEAGEGWKNDGLTGGTAGLKRTVESSCASFSTAVDECFGATTLIKNLHETSGSLRVVESGRESPLLEVVRGLSEGFDSARICLIWYIDEKFRRNSRQPDDRDSATDD